MSFVSFEFSLFFLIVLIVFFALPQRRRWLLLLIASYIFYARWNASYIVLIIFSTLVDYFASRELSTVPSTEQFRRRLLLFTSLIINLGILFVFKYFNFFSDSIALLLPGLSPVNLDVLLPVGISFYTFQSMSYTIDVYRGKIPAETHLGVFATYVAFFPQLVAGPIERAANILPQFRKRFWFNYDRVIAGLRLILWGVFKKVAVADTLAVYVNDVYNQVEHYTGIPLIFATVFFALQIYCDFSGYSDIAVGTAQILGFKLMENFRQPYLSTSIREFWRRWHISLSTWFRDYLYIPLGGNRISLVRTVFNLMVVFVVSGLWHGANWTFVIWGAIHGLYVVIEMLYSLSPLPPLRLPRLMQTAWTFSLVCFAWIFFRANSLADAIYIVTHLLDLSGDYQTILGPAQVTTTWQLWLIVLIIILVIGDLIDANWGLINLLGKRPVALRWLIYYLLLALITFALLIADSNSQSFIYFQF